jgi:maltooligosyltrehalose trehalohydrolase
MGATPTTQGVVFRVWAPNAGSVELELAGIDDRVALERDAAGVWSATVPQARPGTRYGYLVNGEGPFPDPYSRSQPEGVHGLSEVVDTRASEWHDSAWRGLSIEGLVVYQLHVGAATPQGTFDSLIGQLPRLRALGVNAIEPLPVAEFPGNRNWGYDGVDLFAPSHVYGGPAGLQRLVDAAHQHGLGVILDVVYNHLGPDGNYLRVFSPDYFTDRYQTPWGEAINYDGPRSEWVRKFVVDNACYWLREYHADGLRLDATHAIFDASEAHILAEVTRRARQSVERPVVLIAETHENDVRYLKPVDEGGFGFDAAWADDFHHVLRRHLAGDSEGYYGQYAGTVEELALCINQGWLRNTPAGDRPPWQFVYVIQNHDQVGNRAFGERLHHQIDLAGYRSASTLLLFLACTPMLFMGQEFATSSPFQYFTDHSPELGRLVTEGRRKEFKAFSAFADPASRERIPDPQSEETFLRSKLPLVEADRGDGAELVRLYQRLLELRRTDPVLVNQSRETMRAKAIHEEVLAVQRWSGADERLLLVNFGDAEAQVTEFGAGWQVLLDSGEPATVDHAGVHLAGRSASVLARGAP